MKRLALLVCSLTMFLGQVCAQQLVSDDKNGTPTGVTVNTNESAAPKANYESAVDIMYDYNSELKLHAIGFGGDHCKGGYFCFGSSFGGANGVDMFSLSFGYGLQKRHVFNDVFFLQGKLYPYIGYSSVEIGDESENDFDYGLQGSVAVGLRLWKTPKGNSVFLTGGYSLSAPEFEFSDLTDNGSWGVGITIVYY